MVEDVEGFDDQAHAHVFSEMDRAREPDIELIDGRRSELVTHCSRQTVVRAVAVVVRIAADNCRVRRARLKLDDA